jgi:phage terminase large subunit-like protein
MTYKGSQYACLYFDQLEEFTEDIFFYMLSRNRTKCGIKPYVRGTANPQPGWLADFLDWWIDKDGYANLARAGIPRWFVRIGDDLEWAENKEILEEKYCYIEPPEKRPIPKSVTFIPATIFDNPELMSADPNYLSNLMALPLVERERLLGDQHRGGNWKIVPAAGLLYNRSWYELVANVPRGGVEVLFWDLAATEKKKGQSYKPSYTSGVLIRKVDGEYYIKYVFAEQLPPAEVEPEFLRLSSQFARLALTEGVQFAIRWEREPGSAAKREAIRLAGLLDGLDAKGIPSIGDKFVRGRGFASASEAGFVKDLPPLPRPDL